jgi:predicted amino acid-binding ACT domain protein
MLKATPLLQVAFACHRETIRSALSHQVRPEGLLRVLLAQQGRSHPVRRTLPRGLAAMTILVTSEIDAARTAVARELHDAMKRQGLTVLNHDGREPAEVVAARRALPASSSLVEIFTADFFTVERIPA